MTQVDLAEKIGRYRSFIVDLERGERLLDVVDFLDISKALGLVPAKANQQIAAALRTAHPVTPTTAMDQAPKFCALRNAENGRDTAAIVISGPCRPSSTASTILGDSAASRMILQA